MQEQVNLSGSDWEDVKTIAGIEYYRLRRLEEFSRPVVENPTSSLWFKRLQVIGMRYNRQVDAIVAETNRALLENLGTPKYRSLVTWIEKRWVVEASIHSQPEVNIHPSSRSFRIYATRYDSGGAYYVALPDKCVKFTNGGNSICSDEGYIVGQKYSVYLSYNGSTGAVVGESGPWNVDDTYWADWNDPTPRRMFADLPLGMPQAQAAYFNGYNGGVDQFGRKVTGPYGIDLARQVSIDIGLQPGTNDWITVSFLWTEGWDNPVGQASAVPGAAEATSAVTPAVLPIQIASPMPDGSVVHQVEYGQSLWQIAIAYNTTIQSINQLNNFSTETIIWPGDELIVLPPGSVAPAATPTSETSPEKPTTEVPTRTSGPASIMPVLSDRTEVASLPVETESDTSQSSSSTSSIYNAVLALGLGLVLIGFLLVGFGRFFLNK